jgi:hypothetical protein
MSDKHPAIDVHETDYGLLTTSQHRGTGNSDLWRLYPWLVPFYVLVPSEPGTPMIMNIRVPADDESCWMIRVGYSPTLPLSKKDRELWEHLSARFARTLTLSHLREENIDNDYLIDRYRQRYESFSGIPSVPGQDWAMIERMVPVQGKLGIVDRTRENLCSSDAAIVALRERLLRFAKDLEAGIEPRPAKEAAMYRLRAPIVEVPRGSSVLDVAEPYLQGRTWDRQVRHTDLPS